MTQATTAPPDWSPWVSISAMREPSGVVYQDSWFGSVLSVPLSLASGGGGALVVAGWRGWKGSTMLTKEAAGAAADTVPRAAAGLDEAAVPGEPADPEDPQPASGTARTASATAGASSVLRRPHLIGSLRPMDAPPFPPPA